MPTLINPVVLQILKQWMCSCAACRSAESVSLTSVLQESFSFNKSWIKVLPGLWMQPEGLPIDNRRPGALNTAGLLPLLPLFNLFLQPFSISLSRQRHLAEKPTGFCQKKNLLKMISPHESEFRWNSWRHLRRSRPQHFVHCRELAIGTWVCHVPAFCRELPGYLTVCVWWRYDPSQQYCNSNEEIDILINVMWIIWCICITTVNSQPTLCFQFK